MSAKALQQVAFTAAKNRQRVTVLPVSPVPLPGPARVLYNRVQGPLPNGARLEVGARVHVRVHVCVGGGCVGGGGEGGRMRACVVLQGLPLSSPCFTPCVAMPSTCARIPSSAPRPAPLDCQG